MTTRDCAHRPPPVAFNRADLFRALRFTANHGPRYVRLQAQRMLNRILGPTPRNWAPRDPKLPELTLTPGQRARFHLHPLPLTPLLALATLHDTLTSEGEDPEPADDPL